MHIVEILINNCICLFSYDLEINAVKSLKSFLIEYEKGTSRTQQYIVQARIYFFVKGCCIHFALLGQPDFVNNRNDLLSL